MNAKQLTKSVAKHLYFISVQSYTVAPVDLAASIVKAGAALGLAISGGRCDAETGLQVLYID